MPIMPIPIFIRNLPIPTPKRAKFKLIYLLVNTSHQNINKSTKLK